MAPLKNKKVVVIFGPPGSGKGTQANLVAAKFNLFHLDTGSFLEELVNDPENLKKSSEIRKRKEDFDNGILLDPKFVLKYIKKKITELAKNNTGIVFSGSPRTYFEAFGDKENVGVIKTLEGLYGKNNVIFFIMDVRSEDSIKRNSTRTVCSVCKATILGALNIKLKQCPFCGGPLRVRSLDKVEVIKVRLVEYTNRTAPIIKELKKRGYRIQKIDGKKMPYLVFQTILKRINDFFKNN